jgi:lipid II:glycine glycyltransferase (peptidoglycan interpeptide bridge formation enzyme)
MGGVIHCPDGPIVAWEDEALSRTGLRLLQAEAKKFGSPVGAVAFRIEPRISRPAPRVLRNWRRAPVDLIPIDTLVIDVCRPLSELASEMHPKARYNLGLSERRGVTVRASQDLNDLAAFYRLFESTAQRSKFFCEPYGYFLNLAATLFPVGMAEVVIAEYEQEPAAAMLLVHFGRRSTFMYGGSNLALKRHMPSHALQWFAITRAKEKGSMEYDLFGCDPHGCREHPYYGFSRFKRQLGGRAASTTGAMDLLYYDQLAERMVSEMAIGVGK